MVHRLTRIILLISLNLAGVTCVLGGTTERLAGDIELTRQAGLYFVSVAHGDAHLKFLVDTGAGRSVVDTKAARRLGLTPGAPHIVQGVGGRQQGWSMGKIPFRVGGLGVILDPLATDLGGTARALKVRLDGVLGLDFFAGRTVEIVPGERVMRVHGEWQPEGWRVVELERVNDAYCIRASVGSGGAAADCLLRFDTGCQGSLKLVGAKSASARGAGAEVGTVGVAPKSWRRAPLRVSIRDVSSGELDLAEVPVSLHSRAFFSGEGGLIGLEALTGYRVLIDVSGRRVALLPDR